MSTLKCHKHNFEFENYLLENDGLLSWMNNFLSSNEFTKDVLIKTKIYREKRKL